MGDKGRLVRSITVALVAAAVALFGAPARFAAATVPAATAGPRYTLVTEPAAGLSPIYTILTSAKRTVEMTMYELRDATAEADLVRDAERGVKVEVVLDQDRAKSYDLPAYVYLTSHGVKVRWAPRTYDVTHQKTVTVDGDVSVIMTLNLTSEYYATSRDFAVIDRDGADVDAIEAVFAADFSGASSSPEPVGSHLIWSPGADARLLRIIGSAQHTLYVENEEMREYTIVDALAAAARRGVDVEVVMTYQSSWSSNLDKLAEAGAHVRTLLARCPPLHPRQGHRRRPRPSRPATGDRLAELLLGQPPVQPRARSRPGTGTGGRG